MTRPLCFVLMPFGDKRDAAGRLIRFDEVYRAVIAPAIERAGLDPIRADEERTGGLIHKPMFERLVLCEYAVADLTTANANVFYELGIRHAVRPRSTVTVFAEGTRMPFDVQDLRSLSYGLNAAGTPRAADRAVDALVQRLGDARSAAIDSPLFQLLDLPAPDIGRLKTDVFREQVTYSVKVKERLAAARKEGTAAAVDAVRAGLEPIADRDYGTAVDLLLSYRAVKAWDRMVALFDSLAEPHRHTVLVREQHALALNRAGRSEDAERELRQLIDEHGPSTETNGLLGRVYKDRWLRAQEAGDALAARGLLEQAIATYRAGFEADWRDAYPGVNAVTLMELRCAPDESQRQEQRALLPVVTYAARRRAAGDAADYWDFATLMELAVLGDDQRAAEQAAGDALARIREPWEAESTLRTLRTIREARARRGAPGPAWVAAIEQELAKHTGG